MLSETDIRLISLLEEDGRSSYRQIASSLGISPTTVAHRVGQLQKKGLLTIKAVPNPFKINHTAAAVIGMNVSMAKIDNICNRLKNIFNVISIIKTFGRFNLLVSVYFPSWEELHGFISSGLFPPGENYEAEIFFVKEIARPFSQKIQTGERATPVEIDDLDRRIIELLSENGRYSGVYIARKLNISVSAVSKRLARLFREEVIQVRGQVNPTRLGYHANALIFLRVTPGRLEEVCKKLLSYKELNTILSLINSYDIYVNAMAKDTGELYEFIKNKMTPQSGILNIETFICGEVVKRYYNAFRIKEMFAAERHTGRGASKANKLDGKDC